jgi:arylsulfatase A-like enzyme
VLTVSTLSFNLIPPYSIFFSTALAVRSVLICFYMAVVYRALIMINRLLSKIGGSERLAAYLPSLIGTLLINLFVLIYVLNFFLVSRIDGFMTLFILELGLEDLQYTLYMINSFGVGYLIALILLIVFMILSSFLLFKEIDSYFRLKRIGGLFTSKTTSFFIILVTLLILIPSTRLVALKHEPAAFFIASAVHELSSVNVLKHPPPTYKPPKLRDRKNVVLIFIETLRADHVPAYGYPRNTMPFLSRIAENSLIATDFYCNAPTTSYTLIPLIYSKHYCYGSVGGVNFFDIMKFNGYKTSVFYPAYLYWAGLDKKVFNRNVDYTFDLSVYSRESGSQKSTETPIILKYMYPSSSFSDDYVAFEKAKEWISGLKPSERFFMFIGPQSPHSPYFFNTDTPHNFTPVFTPYCSVATVNNADLDIISEIEPLVNRYDNSLLYLDTLLKDFFSFMEDRGLLDDTMVIVTGDHGEAFGEHNSLFHSTTLYSEQIHVPFIIYNTGLNSSMRIKHGQHVDVMPTALYLLGAENVSGFDGLNLITETRNISYFCYPMKHGVVKADYKYVYDPVTREEEVYDLIKDPLEGENIAGSSDKKLLELRWEYKKFLEEYIN